MSVATCLCVKKSKTYNSRNAFQGNDFENTVKTAGTSDGIRDTTACWSRPKIFFRFYLPFPTPKTIQKRLKDMGGVRIRGNIFPVDSDRTSTRKSGYREYRT